uniref:Uncharacterized protein n=1 Tax=Helicotheca tamesis TaxID=374047 RepID=A0A7S2MHP4_9STRA|mmetsp:Transcript_16284/g.22329  ORF Transcript_16284/g.22329 Transcript_16284/m.22329 type:complete len:154 (+) Transcript_16284:118-579(+)|eukprot:CAMPEP_0185725456 /NCGR_PEP_ID=MMETSP1171-20130828/1718_1 /TAXON_ID=374046 /ORGANISM="Helicotheca tamensis, Strain CCMP826" /LENGTH=153 /DNA_ID=CAMNT_0028393595 /DNA_START=51 /DNA_END=512 /DNA_ORIENTATION=-
MSSANRRIEHQHVFLRQATILRKNLYDWDRVLRSQVGEDWPSMLGKLNAALSQSGNLDQGIEDLLEHFVYEPKKCPVNPQDVPFFLSTRLADSGTVDDTDTDAVATSAVGVAGAGGNTSRGEGDDEDPVKVLRRYEDRAGELVSEFENAMVRF